MDREIYPNLDRALVFADLEPIDKGTYYLVRCPACGKREAYVYKHGFTLQCNRRNNCGYSVSLITYIAGSDTPRGRDFVDAAKALAQLAGMTLPERELSEQEIHKARERERRRDLMEVFFEFARDSIKSDQAKAAIQYLTEQRGISQEQVESFELGFYPERSLVHSTLTSAGFSSDEIESSKLTFDTRWEGRIVAPWRDRYGRIVNAWTRDLSGKSEEHEKYLMLSGGSKASPWGLDAVRGQDVVLVEGFMDALAARANGIENVVALGGAAITDEQISTLASARIRRIILNFDCDPAGIKATNQAIDKLARGPFEVFVVDPLLMADLAHPDNKVDPDAFIRTRGADVYRQLLEGTVHAFRYKARAIVDANMGGIEWTDSQKLRALDEAIEFDASVTDVEKVTALSTCFWPEILELTGADWEAVQARIQSVREKVEQEREQRTYSALIREAQRALEAQDMDAAKSLLRERVEQLRAEERISGAEPVVSISDELATHEERLERWRGSEFLGLPQRTIPTLDESTLGLRGLMLLAAAPNVGKTALSVQIGLDVVQSNPDACFLFVSLEMSRWDIISRMKCCLAEMDWKTLVFGSQGSRGRGRGTAFSSTEMERLRQAEEKLSTLGSRIRILDERNFPHPTLERVIAQVQDLKARSGAKRAFVLVDYLQVWPIPEHEARNIKSDLDADKWRIGAMKAMRDAGEDDAIMVISEARKPSGTSKDSWGGDLSDVMGSARGSYTPDMVFLFRPFADDELTEELSWNRGDVNNGRRELSDAGKSYNKLIIAKGRDGVLRRSIDLTFWFRESRFEEGIA